MRNLLCKILFAAMLPVTAWAQDQPLEQVTLVPEDRILVLAPHPDDEVLGAGGILQRARSIGAPVKVVFFTHGDSNQWSFLLYRRHPVIMPRAVEKMGLIRRDEALAASSILGVPKQDLVFLGYPDFGTIGIWYSHWNKRPPLRSILTRVTKVPYEGAFRQGAPYKGEEILKDLGAILADFKPTKVFVSHPADHNGDHLALYLFTRVALWDQGMEGKVGVYPYLIHRLNWPRPAGFHPNQPLAPPDFARNAILWREFTLTQQEFDLKKGALQAHKSQYVSTPKYLLSFIKPNELFGDFPTLHLRMNNEVPLYAAKRAFVPQAELPDEFSSREKDAFVGVQWKFVRWEGDNLVISIALSKPLAQDVEASVYIFGYNKAVPFSEMPKINVRLGFLSHTVYNQAQRIEQSSVTVRRTADEINVTIPFKLLGDPDRFLTSAFTYLGNVPLDSSSWLAVELN